MTDFTTQRLTALIQDIHQEFDNGSNRVGLAERFFVDVFLPMFAGDAHPKYAATPQQWNNVARGPFNEVNVYNTDNELLYVVPALFSQDAIKPITGTGQSARMATISSMLQTATHYANRGPAVMQAMIKNELDKRAFLFDANSMNQDNIARWNAIFARYNRPLLPIQGRATSTSAHADIARDSTEFDPL